MSDTAPGAAAPVHQDRVLGLVRRDHVQRYSTLVVLILMFLVFSLGVDRFLTSQNLLNIAQQISMLTIVGAGLTFGFAAREMDLSVGYTVGMAGVLVPLLLVGGTALPLALLAGLAAGLAVGLINATLVTVIGIPSLIATLAMGSILFGINFLMTGGRAIYGEMRRLAARGVGILIASSDLLEIESVAHRVIPFVRQSPGPDIPAAEFSESTFITAISRAAA